MARARRSGSTKQPPKLAVDRLIIVAGHSESPYGGVEKVHRRHDPIDTLYRRKWIEQRQFQAADRCRQAFQICNGGGMRCALDASTSAGSTSRTPSPYQLAAAEDLHDVATILGYLDAPVVLQVCGHGDDIGKTATVLGIGGSERDKDEVGRRLRRGLSALADHWWPLRHQRPRNRVFRQDDARPTIPIHLAHVTERHAFVMRGVINPGASAHADGHRVNYTTGSFLPMQRKG